MRAFRKLKKFVEYKAEERGLFVDTVNPKEHVEALQ
jgi:IS605 OrfB family transposase